MENNNEEKTEWNITRITLAIIIIIIVGYWGWLGSVFPHGLRQQTIEIKLIEDTEKGCIVYAYVYNGWDGIEKIHMTYDKHQIQRMEEGKRYNIIFRVGYIRYRWSVLKIEEIKPRR